MKGVWIELISEWMGRNPGCQLHMWENAANILIERGTAKAINKMSGARQEDPVIKEDVNKGIEEEIEVKAIENPPQDKMVKQPKKTKRFK